MIAIPIDTDTSTTLSKLYGNAPFFALLDPKTGLYSVIENEEKGNGPKSAPFLQSKEVTATLFYHMGEGVYKACKKAGIDVYSADKKSHPIKEIFEMFQKEAFEKLNDENFASLLDPGTTKCTCGCE